MSSKEYYKILGVNEKATSEEINRAYKRAALEHHPDKGGDPENFKRIQKAKETLLDSKARQAYDAGLDPDKIQIPSQDGFPPQGFPFQFPVNVDIGNIFEQLFRDKNGSGQNRRQAKAPPKLRPIPLTLEQFYYGHSFDINYERLRNCGDCSGKGFSSTEPCTDCNGSGQLSTVIQMGPMIVNSVAPCNSCKATGQRGKDRCEPCSGRGKVAEKGQLKVNVPAGTPVGHVIVFNEACSEEDAYERPGDMHVILTEVECDGWIRNGFSLETTVTIGLGESLVGCKMVLDEHPRREEVEIEIPCGTQSGERLTFKGLGMPVGTGKNDNLYVTVQVKPKPGEREKLRDEGRAYLASLFGIKMP